MKPLVTEKSYLACHEQQGYKVGDIRGGISETVSLAEITALQKTLARDMWIVHTFFRIMGVTAIYLIAFLLIRNVRRQQEYNLERKTSLIICKTLLIISIH